MSVVLSDLDVWKKEISVNELFKNKEFLHRLSLSIDEIEDELFWQIMIKNDNWNKVWTDYFNNYLSSRLWK